MPRNRGRVPPTADKADESGPNGGATKRKAEEKSEKPTDKRQKPEERHKPEEQGRETKKVNDEWVEMAKRIKQNAEKRAQ